ncbi:MAG: adenylosuccinate lyase [Euryarchaeota archaeon]|nr:adenylosuccinate lyase [Euryarchaeota archaeon]
MAIHPIEYRYGTEEMKQVWSEETRLRKLLYVESALARAESDVGLILAEDAGVIAESIDQVSLSRVKEIEDEIHHDVMALVLAISEQCGDSGRWVHFGATSSDILDTATALQMRDAIDILREKLYRLLDILLKQSDAHKQTVCAGRTHGQIGVPTTYGMRFAIWACEINRHIERLDQLSPRIVVGKIGGAVGTQASFGENGIAVQKKTMEYLNLGSVEVANQIIQRDRHAEFVLWMANTVTTLDKACTTIRNLQRSEIAEVEEGFGKRQVGSSTMPHKRNPIKSEQVCGLARIVRAMVEPELLNNTLWDERDLTNSSCERVVFPEACILTDHLINLTTKIISNLKFYPENIKRNLDLLKGLNMAESVMIALAKQIGRQEAHRIIRDCSMEARESRRNLRDVLLEREDVNLDADEIEAAMNPYRYIGTAVEQVDMVVARLQKRVRAYKM